MKFISKVASKRLAVSITSILVKEAIFISSPETEKKSSTSVTKSPSSTKL